MDTFSHTDLTAFLEFCKSLDAAMVHSPEEALELYRTRGENGRTAPTPGDLGRDLMRLRKQIEASGAPLLNEVELDRELAARRGEQLGED